MEEAHYDTPWEFLHRTASFPPRDRPRSDSSELLLAKRLERGLHTRGIGGQQTNSAVGLSCSYQSSNVKHNHPIIRQNIHGKVLQRVTPTHLPESDVRRASSTELERGRFKFSISRLRDRANGRDSRRFRYREEEIIHKGIDRVDAERQLSGHDIGAFLIRVRDNGALALSIKASRGVLHIKLELRDSRWVLGEGPTFGSIASIISFYRCHELPIRGADRMLLNKPVLVTTNSTQSQTPVLQP
uniref:SH2 domain-containing protein n=1 Tax=Setaria digitata TaxID=48799 RepID=A0A915Q6A7_9BILA